MQRYYVAYFYVNPKDNTKPFPVETTGYSYQYIDMDGPPETKQDIRAMVDYITAEGNHKQVCILNWKLLGSENGNS